MGYGEDFLPIVRAVVRHFETPLFKIGSVIGSKRIANRSGPFLILALLRDEKVKNLVFLMAEDLLNDDELQGLAENDTMKKKNAGICSDVSKDDGA